MTSISRHEYANLFGPTMANPYSLGFKSGATPTFGQPLYTVTTTTAIEDATAKHEHQTIEGLTAIHRESSSND